MSAVSNSSTRRDVEFDADGTTLRGWFYPAPGSAPAAAVVMAHGFSLVKEAYLDRYAERFVAAGLAVLVYDHRNFGASDGSPRQEIDPLCQIEDYRHAITYASTLPEVDPDLIGVWGTSYSGGHAIVVAASDLRVKAVVCQAPAVNGVQTGWRRTPMAQLAAASEQFAAERIVRMQTGDRRVPQGRYRADRRRGSAAGLLPGPATGRTGAEGAPRTGGAWPRPRQAAEAVGSQRRRSVRRGRRTAPGPRVHQGPAQPRSQGRPGPLPHHYERGSLTGRGVLCLPASVPAVRRPALRLHAGADQPRGPERVRRTAIWCRTSRVGP
ncbi:alpha/beta hydrolase [Streptomyces seoulensis]